MDKNQKEKQQIFDKNQEIIDIRATEIAYGALHQTAEYQTSISNNHSHLSRHYNHSDKEKMDLMFYNAGKSHSEFGSKQIANDCVAYVIFKNAAEIAQWVENTPEHQENNKPVTMNLHGETKGMEPKTGIIGQGFSVNKYNKIREYKSSHTTVVIERNNNSKYGFSVLTAYPDLLNHSIPTGRNCNEIVKNTLEYKYASTMRQVYLDKSSDPNWRQPLRYDKNNDTIRMSLTNDPEFGTDAVFYSDHVEIQKHRIVIDNADTAKWNQYPGRERIYKQLKEDIQKAFDEKDSAKINKQIAKSTAPTMTHEQRIERAEKISNNIQSNNKNKQSEESISKT